MFQSTTINLGQHALGNNNLHSFHCVSLVPVTSDHQLIFVPSCCSLCFQVCKRGDITLLGKTSLILPSSPGTIWFSYSTFLARSARAVGSGSGHCLPFCSPIMFIGERKSRRRNKGQRQKIRIFELFSGFSLDPIFRWEMTEGIRLGKASHLNYYILKYSRRS
uniref:Uncharacterized protein n=1 Tax=Heterorhabditis bacteriophora TaxID=37862 RepID=A0A1I7WQE8_HETBA